MSEDLNVGMKCVKYMLFVANFLFVLTSILVISIGGFIKEIYNEYDLFMSGHFFSPAKLLIAIGIIMFLVAFFGCIGALRESTFLVNIYALLLGVVLILEISTAIAALAMSGNIHSNIESNMYEALNDVPSDNYAKSMWDFTQSELGCCGVNNFTDWVPVLKTETVPASCYLKHYPNFYYASGCLNDMVLFLYQSFYLIGSTSFCIALMQLTGIIFARLLAKTIRTIKSKRLVERQQQRDEYIARNKSPSLSSDPFEA